MQGLIVDWGGVLTMPIHTAMASWLKATGVDGEHFGAVLRRWVQPSPGVISPVHRLERGELAVEEFEHLLSEALAQEGSLVEAQGLVSTMLADLSIYEDSMTSLVTRAHAAGIRTGLLSNSWGNDYDRSDWHEMFDTVVISGEVDIPHNISAAAQAGLVGILHRTFDETASELETLFPAAGWIHQRLR
jgi:hypothetical protein